MEDLHAIQKAFTKHLRNPDHVSVPEGLDKRRVGIYSELIFNNLSSILSDFFPVIKSILDQKKWDLMVRNFFISHDCRTPYFMEISTEFSKYLNQSQLPSNYPSFLPELAHYEWIELSLYTKNESHPPSKFDPNQLLDNPLTLSPLAEPVAYRYPVQKICTEFLPENPGAEPTLLLVLRDLDESVRFFELQPLAFHLIKQIQESSGLVPRQWLIKATDQIDIQDKKEFIDNGLELLKSFNEYRVFT